MIARIVLPSDELWKDDSFRAKVLGLVPGSCLGKNDTLFVCIHDGDVIGALVARHVYYIHDVATKSGNHAVLACQALVNYALGYAKRHGITDEIILSCEPSNTRMQNYLQDAGAERDEPSVDFFMRI